MYTTWTAGRPHWHEVVSLVVKVPEKRLVFCGQTEVNERVSASSHVLVPVVIIGVHNSEPLLHRQISFAIGNRLLWNPVRLRLEHACSLTVVLIVIKFGK